MVFISDRLQQQQQSSEMGSFVNEVCFFSCLFLLAMFHPGLLSGVTEGLEVPGRKHETDNVVDRSSGAPCGCKTMDNPLSALGTVLNSICSAVETNSNAAKAAESKMAALEARVASIEKELEVKFEQCQTNLQVLLDHVTANFSSFEDSLRASKYQGTVLLLYLFKNCKEHFEFSN